MRARARRRCSSAEIRGIRRRLSTGRRWTGSTPTSTGRLRRQGMTVNYARAFSRRRSSCSQRISSSMDRLLAPPTPSWTRSSSGWSISSPWRVKHRADSPPSLRTWTCGVFCSPPPASPFPIPASSGRRSRTSQNSSPILTPSSPPRTGSPAAGTSSRWRCAEPMRPASTTTNVPPVTAWRCAVRRTPTRTWLRDTPRRMPLSSATAVV